MTTETQISPYACKPATGLAEVWWFGGRVVVKVDSAQTCGRVAQIEADDPRGTAPPVHIHHAEDETFYVISGSMTIFAGDTPIDATAGDFVFVPRGTPHSYLVTSDRAQLLATFSPAGMEEFFVEAGVQDDGSGVPPAEGVFPPPEELVRTLARYNCEVVGPPPTLADLGL